jgi:hypothetical protein
MTILAARDQRTFEHLHIKSLEGGEVIVLMNRSDRPLEDALGISDEAIVGHGLKLGALGPPAKTLGSGKLVMLSIC